MAVVVSAAWRRGGGAAILEGGGGGVGSRKWIHNHSVQTALSYTNIYLVCRHRATHTLSLFRPPPPPARFSHTMEDGVGPERRMNSPWRRQAVMEVKKSRGRRRAKTGESSRRRWGLHNNKRSGKERRTESPTRLVQRREQRAPGRGLIHAGSPGERMEGEETE